MILQQNEDFMDCFFSYTGFLLLYEIFLTHTETGALQVRARTLVKPFWKWMT